MSENIKIYNNKIFKNLKNLKNYLIKEIYLNISNL